MIITMKIGRRTQSRRAGSRKSDWVDPVMASDGEATRFVCEMRKVLGREKPDA
jgi:hypothetical protein